MANQTSLVDERSPVLHTFRTVAGDSFNRLSQLLKSDTDSSSDVVDDAILPEILNELALNSVDDLPSTLHILHQTQKRLQSQLENLAAEHYPVFLAKADASHNALKNLSNIVSANNALISRVPDLSDCAQAFLSKARILNDAIKINSKALDRHAQLLELLELPQLMETSIQNGHFDDAIAILAYAKRLAKKRGSTIPIIKIISSQVNAVGSQLIHQLCNQLRSPLSLPICIKVVVFLRRTGVFTEQELRLKFLQARTTCLINQLASGLTAPRISEVSRKEIDDHKTGGFRNPNRARYEAYWKATRRVEITRVQLFDIVTQYRTVFSEREHTTNFQQPDLRSADWTFLNRNTTTLSTNPLCLTADLQGNDPLRFNTNLLHAWLIHRIGVFLDTFATDLQQMLHQPSFTIQEVVDRWSSLGQSGSSADTTFGSDLDMEALFTNLQSLISQSMYFGRSFSRIGCDFRPHLVDLFYNAISSYVKVFLSNATDEFSIALDNLLWKVTNAFLDDPKDMPNGEVINDQCHLDKKTTFPPANDLLSYPPLVVLYNRIMELFNGLRVCCPVGLKHRLATLIVDCLTSASSRVVTSYRLLVDQQTVNWRSDAADLASGFYNILVPNVISSMCSQLLSAVKSEGCSEKMQSRVQILVQCLTRFVCEPMEKNWPRIPSYGTTTLQCISEQNGNCIPLTNEDTRPIDELATSHPLVENHVEKDCASDVN